MGGLQGGQFSGKNNTDRAINTVASNDPALNWALHSAFGGGDDSANKPDPVAPMLQGHWKRNLPKDSTGLSALYEEYSRAGGLYGQGEFTGTSLGRGASRARNRASQIGIMLGNQGVDTSKLNTSWNTPEGAPDYGQVDTAAQDLRMLSGRKGAGAKFSGKAQRFIQTLERDKNLADFNKNVDPTLENISNQTNDLLSHPALGGEEISRLRSNITTNAQMAATSRMKRVAAVLGQRGIDAHSPMASILAEREANSTDQDITNSLREFDLSSDEFNRSDKQRSLGLASQAITSRIAGRNAALSGDSSKMFQVQENVGSMLAVIAQQQQLKDIYSKMYSQKQTGGATGAASGAISGATAGSAFGPWGTVIGGVVGGAAGYFG